MDKYTRKQIERWENKKEKLRMRDQQNIFKNGFFGDYAEVLRQVNAYNPVVSGVITEVHRNRMLEVQYIRAGFAIDDRVTDTLSIGMIPFNNGLLKIDYTKLDYRIDVPGSVQALKQAKYTQRLYRECVILVRYLVRMEKIKDELLKTASKFATIRNCKTIKEDLMKTVWHPRRLETFVEKYGWEAFDNLLGVE